MSRIIALASGVLPGEPAETVVDAAAAAGFGGVGLWVEPREWSSARIATVRRRAADAGVTIVDTEVLRIDGDGLHDDDKAMVDIAAGLGAAHVLVVGGSGEAAAIADRYAELCALGQAAGVAIAIEFMLFSRVRTLDDAARIVRDAASPAARLLLDPLHLDRAGYPTETIAALPHDWLSYAQFCDAPHAHLAPDDASGLLDEARHDRLLPGDGVLPLRSFVEALPPETPLSLELRSRELREKHVDPHARAAAVMQAMNRWLEKQELKCA